MGELNLNTRVRSVLRFTAAGATAAFLAGCSSDMNRLSGGPFGPADNTPTASIGSQSLTPPEAISGAGAVASASAGSWGAQPSPSAGSIQSAPLAPPTAAAAPRPMSQAAPAAAVTAAARSAGGSFGPWTTAGGTPVTVAQGESASVLAARYGVPMDALIKANGLTSATQVTPGKSLVIPVYNAAARQASATTETLAAPAARNAAKTAATATTAATTNAVANATKTAKAAAEPAKAQATRVADAARKPEQKAADAAKQRAEAEAAKKAAATKAVAAKEAAKPAETVKAKEVAQAPQPAEPAATPAADKPEFRWPARGRIIQGFKSGANDGIAISVPEGTAVKAAESGVVAYAGSELKGYGNLVLIRHPNGFVSAYAHNGEISVKRGESVKRGQTIAKSGQTGNVSAPQLHFELRKGSTPVDPTQYLAGI